MYKIGDLIIRTHHTPAKWRGEKAVIVGDPSFSFENWRVKILSTGKRARWDPDFFRKIKDEIIWEV